MFPYAKEWHKFSWFRDQRTLTIHPRRNGYRFPFFLRARLLFPAALPDGAPRCCNSSSEDLGPAATGSFTFFFISGARAALSLRKVSSREANMAPSEADDLSLPPAAPIPSRPSTNFSASNWKPDK